MPESSRSKKPPDSGDRHQEYMPLSLLPANPANPKGHDLDGVKTSMDRFGFVEPVTLDERTGLLVSGHGRVEALTAAFHAGLGPPQGVRIDEGGGWLVPVNRGWASADDREAAAALVALNRYVERGGWQERPLSDLLSELVSDSDPSVSLAGVGFDPADLRELLDRQHDETMAHLGLIEENRRGSDQSGELNDAWAVVVVCADEAQQIELLARFAGEGLQARALLA